MKYERLTRKSDDGYELKRELIKSNSYNEFLVNSLQLAIVRLAELEDKIENGTLVSIPFIRKHPKIDNAYMVVYETEYGDLFGKMYCGENAQAEAEQKLKELQKEK